MNPICVIYIHCMTYNKCQVNEKNPTAFLSTWNDNSIEKKWTKPKLPQKQHISVQKTVTYNSQAEGFISFFIFIINIYSTLNIFWNVLWVISYFPFPYILSIEKTLFRSKAWERSKANTVGLIFLGAFMTNFAAAPTPQYMS